MSATDPTLEERVAALERAQKNLASSVETLKRGQRETRAQVRNLEKLVEGIPATIKQQLDEQTSDLRADIAEADAANAQRTTNTYKDLANQLPTWAAVVITLLGTFLVGLVVDLVLAATGHPHVR